MKAIERDESFNRDYIPLLAGWEIQTKGKGSSFRICKTNLDDPEDYHRMIVMDEGIHQFITQMALENHEEIKKLLNQIEELKLAVRATAFTRE